MTRLQTMMRMIVAAAVLLASGPAWGAKLLDLALLETEQTIARNGVSTLIHHEEFDSFGSPGTYGDIPSGWAAYEADSETVDYFIAPEHNCTLKLLEVTNYPAYVVLPTAVPRHFYGAQHVDGGWDAGAVASSGRPCFVPYDDGTMRLYGHHSAEMFCTTYQSQADDIRKLVRYMTRTVTAANPAIESRSMHMGLALSL